MVANTENTENEERSINRCEVSIFLKSGSILKFRDYMVNRSIGELLRNYNRYCESGEQSNYKYWLFVDPDSTSWSGEICIQFKNIEAIYLSELNE